MRILHVIHTPRYSGAEMLVAALAIIHFKLGHSSCVVSIRPPEEDFIPMIRQQNDEGIEWVTPAYQLGRWARVSFLRKAAARFRADVTFAHSVIPSAYARLAGNKNVISVLHSETNYESGYVRWLEKLLQYQLAGLIAVSERARQQYKSDFSHPQTLLVPNGISVADVRRPLCVRRAVRQSLSVSDAARLILQVGRITRIKQQHLSLQALVPLMKKDASIHFLLAGLVEESSYLDELKCLAAAEGVEERVHFLGPRRDVADLMCAADLFVMPSIREAHSVAMIEALAAGLPIIASPIPSFRYACAFPGVSLLSPELVEQVTSAIQEALIQPRRYERELKGLDISDTAAAYIEFAAQCMS